MTNLNPQTLPTKKEGKNTPRGEGVPPRKGEKQPRFVKEALKQPYYDRNLYKNVVYSIQKRRLNPGNRGHVYPEILVYEPPPHGDVFLDMITLNRGKAQF